MAMRHACTRVAQRPRSFRPSRLSVQTFASTPREHRESSSTNVNEDASSPSTEATTAPNPERELGPMERRLEEATEEALLTGGRAGRRAIEDAGFSEELKERLLNKVSEAKFRTEHASAFATAGMPASAGEGTRVMAAAQPWTGEEAPADAVLRMLNDARKPLRPELRGKPQIPNPVVVDMRIRREPVRTAGQRAASARDKAEAYAGSGMKNQGLSADEREAMSKEFKDRFQPGSRAMPNTITGLAALANERIENAIARGQFKNIPRGKGVERDARAGNPFIDTTEYILNKMIKRQDITPPWIEKQQELVKAATVFRTRLRNDWRRHAARIIASRGGSLDEQMERARLFALAEQAHNPKRRHVDQIAVPTNATDDPVMVKMRQQAWSDDQEASSSASRTRGGQDASMPSGPLPAPLRDSAWEATERSYMELAVENLNALTRSYNLMAPDLAKKPYFSLDRELRSCFADVAPEVAETIRIRATRPAKSLADVVGDSSATGILERLGGDGKPVRVYDSKTPNYGFKDFWKDWWSKAA